MTAAPVSTNFAVSLMPEETLSIRNFIPQAQVRDELSWHLLVPVGYSTSQMRSFYKCIACSSNIILFLFYYFLVLQHPTNQTNPTSLCVRVRAFPCICVCVSVCVCLCVRARVCNLRTLQRFRTSVNLVFALSFQLRKPVKKLCLVTLLRSF